MDTVGFVRDIDVAGRGVREVQVARERQLVVARVDGGLLRVLDLPFEGRAAIEADGRATQGAGRITWSDGRAGGGGDIADGARAAELGARGEADVADAASSPDGEHAGIRREREVER